MLMIFFAQTPRLDTTIRPVSVVRIPVDDEHLAHTAHQRFAGSDD